MTLLPPNAAIATLHDDTSALLDLRLVRPTDAAVVHTPIGERWRHTFDIVLTARGERRVIHDASGRRIVFTAVEKHGGRPAEPSGLVPELHYETREPHGGTLLRRADGYRWSRADGVTVEFAGSLPSALDDGRGGRVELVHEHGRLLEARAADGRRMRFVSAGRRLREIVLPDGASLVLEPATDGGLRVRRRVECAPSEDSGRCESDPDADFVTAPGIPGALRIDARPASCRSHFVEHHGTERGFAIESGLDGHAHYAGYAATVRSFPIVDFVGAEHRVVRSRDLASATFDPARAPQALYERLLRDGDEIAARFVEPLLARGEIVVTELGRTTRIGADDARPIVLELVVRHTMASASHIAQIARARQVLAERHAITLRVIEIP